MNHFIFLAVYSDILVYLRFRMVSALQCLLCKVIWLDNTEKAVKSCCIQSHDLIQEYNPDKGL